MSAGLRLIVEADGGSRGNPGPAGYGAVVRDASDGQALVELAESIGRATNNVAEYHGLIAGLGAAADFAADAIEVRMDSKLVVEQMSGRWRVKHPDLRPLHARARDLLKSLPRTRFTWVPRGRNTEADRLANEAMDAAARGETWHRSTGTRPAAEPAPVPPDPAATPAPAAEREPAVPPELPVQPELPVPPESAPEPPRWTATTGVPTTTVLLRHGQTAHSPAGLFSGRGAIELTETGIAQAEAAAKRLARGGFTRIVTSPLRRARQTADVLGRVLGLPVTTEDGLAECDFGRWEGLSLDEVIRRWPDELAAWRACTDVAPPGGESFAAMTVRVDAARRRLQQEYAGEQLIVVSHVGPIKALLQLALDATPALLFRLHLDIASISTIQWYDGGQASVRLVNDTHHWND